MQGQAFMKKVTFLYEFGHPVEAVWPLVTETDRINRVIGLPKVNYTLAPRAEGGADRHAELFAKGIRLRWKEHPYEWEKHRFLRVERHYSKGPFRKIIVDWRFRRTPGGCRVRQTFWYEMKNRLLTPIAWLTMHRDARRGFLECYARINRHLGETRKDPNAASTPFPIPPTDLSLRREARRQRELLERLGQESLDGETSRRMLDLLLTAPDPDVTHIRPFRVAKAWKTDRMATLRAFLAATRAGLFSLTWSAICPNCGGLKGSAPILTRVEREIHCDTCNIRFVSEHSGSIELTFRPSPSVRELRFEEFCGGSPRNTPHYEYQLRVAAGATRTLKLELPPGSYRIRSPQSGSEWSLELHGAPHERSDLEAHLALLPKQGGLRGLTHLDLTAGASLAIRNGSPLEMTVVVERTEYRDDVCTAALMASLPEFRNVFTSQLLDLGQKIDFSSVAILFTDLQGSTALYERIGDARAFVMIQRHFKVLEDCIRAHEGGVVKTIGDSVMAAFASPESALEAGIEIQRKFAEEFHGNEDARSISVKISIHHGPCFLIRLNDILDYFGSAVNLAARLQGRCAGGEIVISGHMIDDPAVRQALRKARLSAEQLITEFKGIRTEVEVYRIDCSRARSWAA